MRLAKEGAKTELVTCEVEHGWNGDVFGQIRAGIEWLEKNHGKPVKER